jgi:hypothetical protein
LALGESIYLAAFHLKRTKSFKKANQITKKSLLKFGNNQVLKAKKISEEKFLKRGFGQGFQSKQAQL